MLQTMTDFSMSDGLGVTGRRICAVPLRKTSVRCSIYEPETVSTVKRLFFSFRPFDPVWMRRTQPQFASFIS